MGKIKILFVDDDLLFGNMVVQVLQENGFEVHYQNTLTGVQLAVSKMNPDLIILDVMVGDDNSLEYINDIKLAANDIPIIFVSSYTELEYEELATSNGAVVYLEKPFTCDKLLMWVKRYARGSDYSKSHLFMLGDYAIDTQTHTLSCHGEEQSLGNTEYETLRVLLLNKNMPVSREFLKNTVWQGVICSNESLNNVICRLRKYLSKDPRICIDTIRKEGFALFYQE